MDRADLIAALEKAEGPSRELDAAIMEVIGLPKIFFGRPVTQWWRHGDSWRCETNDGYIHLDAQNTPSYTASLDAALSLVPDRRAWEIKSTYWSTDKRPAACVVRPDGVRRYGLGATPALALCIAALRAMD